MHNEYEDHTRTKVTSSLEFIHHTSYQIANKLFIPPGSDINNQVIIRNLWEYLSHFWDAAPLDM